MYDFYIETPAILSHVDTRQPLCNKGASKPKPPPPAMAPYEQVEGSSDTSFSKVAQNRKGLRSTILSQPGLNQPVEGNLAGSQATLGQPPVALGSRAPTPPSMVSASAPPTKAPQTKIQTALAGAVNSRKNV